MSEAIAVIFAADSTALGLVPFEPPDAENELPRFIENGSAGALSGDRSCATAEPIKAKTTSTRNAVDRIRLINNWEFADISASRHKRSGFEKGTPAAIVIQVTLSAAFRTGPMINKKDRRSWRHPMTTDHSFVWLSYIPKSWRFPENWLVCAAAKIVGP